MERIRDFLEQKNIPYITDNKFLFACGFVFYQFDNTIACNNPKGSQLLNLTVTDVERLLKRQIRKVPGSINKPFWRQSKRLEPCERN